MCETIKEKIIVNLYNQYKSSFNELLTHQDLLYKAYLMDMD